MVRVGVLSWPLYWGMPSLKRALSMGSELTQAAESPTGPLAGLAVGGELVLMAVQPDWQVRTRWRGWGGSSSST